MRLIKGHSSGANSTKLSLGNIRCDIHRLPIAFLEKNENVQTIRILHGAKIEKFFIFRWLSISIQFGRAHLCLYPFRWMVRAYFIFYLLFELKSRRKKISIRTVWSDLERRRVDFSEIMERDGGRGRLELNKEGKRVIERYIER